MNISKKEYAQLADRYSAPSKLYMTVPKAFVIGGLICCTGQFFTDLYIMIGNDGDTASAYTSITLVLISALLTGFGQYERIAKHAGAGTLVPITGFANAVVSPALEFKTEGLILGTGAKDVHHCRTRNSLRHNGGICLRHNSVCYKSFRRLIWLN